jgi:hypothetical protein
MGLHPLLSALFTRIGPETEDGDDSMEDEDENKSEWIAGKSPEQTEEMSVSVNRDVVSVVKADKKGGSRSTPR